MTPGPTLVPSSVLLAQAAPAIYHRGASFGTLLARVIEGLRWMLETRNEVLVLTGSGSGALEAAIVNCFSPGETLLVVNNGHFGERVVKIARAFGLQPLPIDYEWGRVVDPEDVRRALTDHPEVVGVVVQHSETSSGVVNDVEAVAEVVRACDPRPLMMVDAVSSAGAIRIETDAWDVDLVCGGSQKALGASPGIGFVAVGDRAWERHETASCPRFYWDFTEHRKTQSLGSGPETPWTPAVPIIAGLAASLDLAREQGLENLFRSHQINSEAVKAGVEALGLELFGEDPERAVVTTAVRAPEGIDGNAIAARMRDTYGIVIGPGMGPTRGKVFRIGHLGHVSGADVVATLAALEMTLMDLGMDLKVGSAPGAASEVYRTRGGWI
jgi:aspartate aminotransferase-like enzyme